MEPAELIGLVGLMRRRFVLDDGAEIAVDIDPRMLTRAMTAAAEESSSGRGISRLL
jgi:oxygen-independent coproporphyrinogen-3 oxidase